MDKGSASSGSGDEADSGGVGAAQGSPIAVDSSSAAQAAAAAACALPDGDGDDDQWSEEMANDQEGVKGGQPSVNRSMQMPHSRSWVELQDEDVASALSDEHIDDYHGECNDVDDKEGWGSEEEEDEHLTGRNAESVLPPGIDVLVQIALRYITLSLVKLTALKRERATATMCYVQRKKILHNTIIVIKLLILDLTFWLPCAVKIWKSLKIQFLRFGMLDCGVAHEAMLEVSYIPLSYKPRVSLSWRS